MMFSKKLLEKFTNLRHAGGLKNNDGTGKVEHNQDIIKLYIKVNDDRVITTARFRAYGGVCTIVAGDKACDLIEGKSIDAAIRINTYQILEELGDIPENRQYVAIMADEVIKSAMEDYYKNLEKKLKLIKK